MIALNLNGAISQQTKQTKQNKTKKQQQQQTNKQTNIIWV